METVSLEGRRDTTKATDGEIIAGISRFARNVPVARIGRRCSSDPYLRHHPNDPQFPYSFTIADCVRHDSRHNRYSLTGTRAEIAKPVDVNGTRCRFLPMCRIGARVRFVVIRSADHVVAADARGDRAGIRKPGVGHGWFRGGARASHQWRRASDGCPCSARPEELSSPRQLSLPPRGLLLSAGTCLRRSRLSSLSTSAVP